ncbi:MAG: efflux RND transporter permease subunit [Candidatus Woesebacteria bacterium]
MPTQKPESHKSYLERLTFDPKMLTGVVAKYVTNIRVVLLLLLTIALLGTIAYTQLPKRLNPEVKIPIVTVVTVMPGAGPADVESLVTIPIEDKLRSLKDVDTISSTSTDNVSAITIQFLSKVDRDKAKDDTQSAVDGVNDLPTDALDPQVNALDFEDQPVWTFALVSKKSFPDLMRAAKDLHDKIDDLSKVDRVNTTGFDTQEVVVEASPSKLAEYGLNPFTLSQAIKKARSSYPAGVVETGRNTFSLTIDPTVENMSDIRALQISVNGKVVALSDVATVQERSKSGQQISYVAKRDSPAQPAVTFYVYKTSGSNIDEAGAQVKEVTDAFLKDNGADYQIITLMNTSEEITKQFSDLLKEFRTTILLVMGVLLLFLGLRQSLISSLTVPLTFLSAFFFMRMFGMSINFLSLFSFLLALGLLVDDTIVVVSAMSLYYRANKFTPVETGLLVWKDTIIPIWSTTITTIWSFVPLLLTSGIIGEFIKPIPVVVTVTMISSTAIAVLITLPLMIILLKPVLPKRVTTLLKVLGWLAALGVIFALASQSLIFPLILIVYVVLTLVFLRVLPSLRTRFAELRARIQKKGKFSKASAFLSRLSSQGIIDVEPFAAWYKRTILKILSKKSSRRKVMAAVIIYSIFCFALLPMGFVKNEFFPKTNQDEVFVQLELPAGTTLTDTAKQAEPILEKLRQTPETEFVTAEVGRGGAAGFGGGSSNSNNLAYFSVRLVDKEKRKVPSYEIAEQLRTDFASYTQGTLSVIEDSGGPPAGSDLQIKLLGNDLSQLNTQADKIETFLKANNDVTNVNKSIKEGTSKLVFIPDSTKLAENGLTPDTLGFALRTFASGFTLDSIALEPGDNQKTDIVLRMDTGTANVENLSQLSVTNPSGKSISLLSIGTFVPKVSPTSISRENFQRTISVAAAVRPGFSITTENKKLEDFAKTLNLPTGYEWKTGGVNEENTKSIQSILQAMVLSAILILITMVVQFGSFRQALIVLIVIPLAVSSVFLAYALTGTPLSFPSMIGILSLFGIVVTNSMFIVDKINLNRKEGMSFEESIADAGASRMEPIILTKLCTVFGLLPITLADPLWRGLGGAIISGLLVASTIMLLFIPVLYYSWMKPEEK